jgi:hypothetical protein
MWRVAVVALVLACGRIDFARVAPSPDAPAVAIVNVGNDVAGTNSKMGGSVTLAVAPTGQDDLLVVGASWCCGTLSLPTITDDRGNVWQAAGMPVTDGINGNDYVGLFYTLSSNAGVTRVTVASTFFLATIFSEYANVDTAAPLDGYAAAETVSSIGDSGPLAPSQSGDLLVVVGDDDNDFTTASPAPGFTSITAGYATGANGCMNVVPPASCQGIGMSYEVYDDTAPVHGTLSWQVSASVVVAMAAFRATP